MTLDTTKIRSHLKAFDFKSLFNELGWDHHSAHHKISADGEAFTLSAVAHKRGVQIFECAGGSDGKIPEYAVRRKINKQISKLAHEHLTIFIDEPKTEQIWQWVSKDPGQPARYHERRYHVGQSGEALLQKLEYLTFPLSAEESLTISGVTIRLRDAFQRERVTRRFYDRFKDEHATFLKFLGGIPDKEMERWYVSVMINRVMFIYFVQKKGFLDGDQDYLKHKLAESRKRGKDLFYKQFLCPLFFEGFARKESERSAATNKLLGDVPYFNGGLFLKHQIEELHAKEIQIVDGAFEKLFEFFDQYEWHLDERPLRDDREINPDVLGYIFEKYINQKQMGAYYSKEDITGYISKNTVLPFLFDVARKNCRVAFEGDTSVWRLLQVDPDRYIYNAVRHGVTWDVHQDKPLEAPMPLPQDIENGVDTSKPKLIERRQGWNRPAPPEYALPTEIWREVVARRQRYEAVRTKLAAGEVRDVNDLITYNLDIIQFAQDVIENSEGPELLRAFWHAIVGRVPEKSNEKFQAGVSILDPACGSGAFLFAALNILEPLYEACLVRMEAFLGDLERSGEKHRPEKFSDFGRVLERVSQHPNRRYFILKSMIVNNLFGVDIMDEAIEICKLRLFLKLVAQVDRTEQIEPLPDIDFNIRPGNTLVGYTTLNDVKKAAGRKFAFDDTIERIEERATDVDRLFNRFRQQQTELGGEVTATDKKQLRRNLKVLEDELNAYLAGEYGIKVSDEKSFEHWIKSHKPFHWFIEFHGIISDGGFDVVLGNPPYKELRAVTEYSTRNLSTTVTRNLYPLMIERSIPFLRSGGYLGFIVPISSISTEGYVSLQRIVFSFPAHFSSYDDRPSRLFDGLEHIQLTIHLIHHSATARPKHFVTESYRWSAVEREGLFPTIQYEEVEATYLPGSLPKLSTETEHSILQRVWKNKKPLGLQQNDIGSNVVYYSRKVHNFLQALDFVPEVYDGKGNLRRPSELKEIRFAEPKASAAVFCILNSTLFRWYINVFTDCRHVNKREVDGFRCDLPKLLVSEGDRLVELSSSLSQNLLNTAEFRNMRFGHDALRVQCIIPKKSKSIIDEIDRVLARHYGFTEAELDFIVNYDIKYRMGISGQVDEEE